MTPRALASSRIRYSSELGRYASCNAAILVAHKSYRLLSVLITAKGTWSVIFGSVDCHVEQSRSNRPWQDRPHDAIDSSAVMIAYSSCEMFDLAIFLPPSCDCFGSGSLVSLRNQFPFTRMLSISCVSLDEISCHTGSHTSHSQLSASPLAGYGEVYDGNHGVNERAT